MTDLAPAIILLLSLTAGLKIGSFSRAPLGGSLFSVERSRAIGWAKNVKQERLDRRALARTRGRGADSDGPGVGGNSGAEHSPTQAATARLLGGDGVLPVDVTAPAFKELVDKLAWSLGSTYRRPAGRHSPIRRWAFGVATIIWEHWGAPGEGLTGAGSA